MQAAPEKAVEGVERAGQPVQRQLRDLGVRAPASDARSPARWEVSFPRSGGPSLALRGSRVSLPGLGPGHWQWCWCWGSDGDAGSGAVTLVLGQRWRPPSPGEMPRLPILSVAIRSPAQPGAGWGGAALSPPPPFALRK